MRSENFAVKKKTDIRAKFLNNPKFGLLRELTLVQGACYIVDALCATLGH